MEIYQNQLRLQNNILLDIEREAFLSLCTERKTLERIQHMLKTGKPLAQLVAK